MCYIAIVLLSYTVPNYHASYISIFNYAMYRSYFAVRYIYIYSAWLITIYATFHDKETDIIWIWKPNGDFEAQEHCIGIFNHKVFLEDGNGSDVYRLRKVLAERIQICSNFDINVWSWMKILYMRQYELISNF